ncbi:hypothetical protein Tco_1350297 [Tanacetum coccineum]
MSVPSHEGVDLVMVDGSHLLSLADANGMTVEVEHVSSKPELMEVLEPILSIIQWPHFDTLEDFEPSCILNQTIRMLTSFNRVAQGTLFIFYPNSVKYASYN